MHAVCAPADGAYDPAPQTLQPGVVVGVHDPLMYLPALQLVVHDVQGPVLVPDLYVPAAHVTHVGVVVDVQLPLRYCPAPQAVAHRMHAVWAVVG